MTLTDYGKSPTKPATMLEGVYEKGEEYGFPITPLLVRRERITPAWRAGSTGTAQRSVAREAAWRAALDDPGAQQMTILKECLHRAPRMVDNDSGIKPFSTAAATFKAMF